MRIGIDFDGVLTDFERWQLDYGSKFFSEKNAITVKDLSFYELDQIFDVSSSYANDFWKEHLTLYCKEIDVRRFAKEVMQKWKDLGHTLFIFVDRPFISENTPRGTEMRNLTREWLKMKAIPYDELLFVDSKKLDLALLHHLDLVIDDQVQEIEELSTKLPVFCFHTNYNIHCEGKNIYRCYSWYDIYQTLENKEEL